MRTKRRWTFAQMVNEARLDAARRSWRKAAMFGNLRRLAQAKGRHRMARRCGAAKNRHILRALELAGDSIHVVEATDDCRFYSVRFPGERIHALHLPRTEFVTKKEA
jgi:hypothetical protein